MKQDTGVVNIHVVLLGDYYLRGFWEKLFLNKSCLVELRIQEYTIIFIVVLQLMREILQTYFWVISINYMGLRRVSLVEQDMFIHFTEKHVTMLMFFKFLHPLH